MLHPDARISTTHETEEPVPLQGTLDRLVLRPEQTGWAILYGEHGRERSLGHAQVIADVKEIVLDLPLAELIGRDHVVGGQLANTPQILASSPLDQPGELHVPDHTVAEF